MRNIVYFCSYDDARNDREKRKVSLAGNYKSQYIINALLEMSCSIRILSYAQSNRRGILYRSSTTEYAGGYQVIMTPSYKAYTRIGNLIWRYMLQCWILLWLIRNTNKHDTVLWYHIPWCMKAYIVARHIKKFNAVLEMEEVYSKFPGAHSWLGKQEERLVASADMYIVSNPNMLTEYPIMQQRNSICIHGNYQTDHSEKLLHQGINLVFAGGVDQVHGAAQNAVRMMRFLDNRYVLHMAAYGRDNNIGDLLEEIRTVNDLLGREACVYHGALTGDALKTLFLSADMAINLQPYCNSYMDFAFPSKIVTYLSYGLPILSTGLKTLRMSRFSEYIEFVNDPDPEHAALVLDLYMKNGIHTDPRALIDSLDVAFRANLKEMLNG